MSSYLNINELAESPTFRGRVKAALAVKAAAVLGEAPNAAPTAQLTKRKAFAAAVLTDPAAKVNAVIWLVVTNDKIRAEGMDAADPDIEWVIGWAWDQVAGVTEADRVVPPPTSTTSTTATKSV